MLRVPVRNARSWDRLERSFIEASKARKLGGLHGPPSVLLTCIEPST